MKHGKKYVDSVKLIDRNNLYDVAEAFGSGRARPARPSLMKPSKFMSSWASTAVMPTSRSAARSCCPTAPARTVRVLVFAKGGQSRRPPPMQALSYVGAEEMVAKIQGGWMDFDVVIASPDMMGVVGRLGKVLGPRGLMPNPKAGTVTPDVAKAVTDAKAGKIEYRLDKTNIIHCPMGKVSFGVEKLQENFDALLNAIVARQARRGQGPVYPFLRRGLHHGTGR